MLLSIATENQKEVNTIIGIIFRLINNIYMWAIKSQKIFIINHEWYTICKTIKECCSFLQKLATYFQIIVILQSRIFSVFTKLFSK